jgi:hypothetical protein
VGRLSGFVAALAAISLFAPAGAGTTEPKVYTLDSNHGVYLAGTQLAVANYNGGLFTYEHGLQGLPVRNTLWTFETPTGAEIGRFTPRAEVLWSDGTPVGAPARFGFHIVYDKPPAQAGAAEEKIPEPDGSYLQALDQNPDNKPADYFLQTGWAGSNNHLLPLSYVIVYSRLDTSSYQITATGQVGPKLKQVDQPLLVAGDAQAKAALQAGLKAERLALALKPRAGTSWTSDFPPLLKHESWIEKSLAKDDYPTAKSEAPALGKDAAKLRREKKRSIKREASRIADELIREEKGLKTLVRAR